jgi:hypothetical protein
LGAFPPRDRFSASILSFFRFFSLPLEPALVAKIRAQAVKMPEAAETAEKNLPGAGEPAARTDQFRERLSLAAAAALAKGVELSGEALEQYARALEPEENFKAPAQDPDEPDKQAGHNDGNNGDPYRGQGTEDRGSSDSGTESPLLTVMNRLPGRDGKRWIVIPFTWGPEDQYRAALRILMSGSRPREAERMALEVTGGKSRWLFTVDARDGRKNLDFYRRPFPGKRVMNQAKKEIAALLDLSPERIRPQNENEFPPFAPECRAEALISVNEEV